jgi:transcriptional regulator of met regulon
MTEHPFITAVQDAADTHGLPDGVRRVSVCKYDWRQSITFYVSTANSDEHANTLVQAYTRALASDAAKAALRRDEAAKAAARKLLQEAGLDPAMVSE